MMNRTAAFFYFAIIGALIVAEVGKYKDHLRNLDVTTIFIAVAASLFAVISLFENSEQRTIAMLTLLEARRQTHILIHGSDAPMPSDDALLDGPPIKKIRILTLVGYFFWRPGDGPSR